MARIAGVKSVTQWKYETGKTVPGAEKMARIAEALGVTSQFLLFGRDTVDAVDPESLPEPPFQAWKDFKKTKEYRTLLEPWMLYNLKRFHLGMPDREPTVAVYRGVLYAMLAHDHDETE